MRSRKDRLTLAALALFFVTFNGTYVAWDSGYLDSRKAQLLKGTAYSVASSAWQRSKRQGISYDRMKRDVSSGIAGCKDDSCRTEKIYEGIDRLAEYWYGTPHDYAGTAKEPKDGQIACGYFVSTILQDLGFKLNRSDIGQLESDRIIKRFCDMDTYAWYSNKPASVLEEHVEKHGKGAYILGLDSHVAFINYDGERADAIHSNPIFPDGVVKQDVSWSPIIVISGAKVIGKIDPDKY